MAEYAAATLIVPASPRSPGIWALARASAAPRAASGALEAGGSPGNLALSRVVLTSGIG